MAVDDTEPRFAEPRTRPRRGVVAQQTRAKEVERLEERVEWLEAELAERDRRLESVIDHYEGLLREKEGSPEPEPGGRLRRLLR